MTLIDEREVMFEQEKKQKLKRNIIKIRKRSLPLSAGTRA